MTQFQPKDPVGPPVAATRRRPRPRSRTTRFLFILVAVVLVGNALVGERGFIAMIRAADELETHARMVSVLRAENEGLRTDVRRLREEPRTIEELARRELGLILPGETLFIVTGAPPAGHAPDAVSAEALTVDPSGH